jgi:hypothetical protein
MSSPRERLARERIASFAGHRGLPGVRVQNDQYSSPSHLQDRCRDGQSDLSARANCSPCRNHGVSPYPGRKFSILAGGESVFVRGSDRKRRHQNSESTGRADKVPPSRLFHRPIPAPQQGGPNQQETPVLGRPFRPDWRSLAQVGQRMRVSCPSTVSERRSYVQAGRGRVTLA